MKIDVFDGNDVVFCYYIVFCDVDDVRLGDVFKLMCEYVVVMVNLGLFDEYCWEDG